MPTPSVCSGWWLSSEPPVLIPSGACMSGAEAGGVARARVSAIGKTRSKQAAPPPAASFQLLLHQFFAQMKQLSPGRNQCTLRPTADTHQPSASPDSCEQHPRSHRVDEAAPESVRASNLVTALDPAEACAAGELSGWPQRDESAVFTVASASHCVSATLAQVHRLLAVRPRLIVGPAHSQAAVVGVSWAAWGRGWT